MYNLLEQIKNLENKYVTIGIHGDKGEQKKLVRLHPKGANIPRGTKREAIDPNITVAQVAAENEFGNRKKNIPQRSFLRSVLKEKKREINQLAQNALKKPEIFYDVIGSYILNEVNKKIVSGISPANSPYTIKRKGSSTPLVDTGQLKAALTYKVSNYD
jgi:phage gpG-like protein